MKHIIHPRSKEVREGKIGPVLHIVESEEAYPRWNNSATA